MLGRISRGPGRSARLCWLDGTDSSIARARLDGWHCRRGDAPQGTSYPSLGEASTSIGNPPRNRCSSHRPRRSSAIRGAPCACGPSCQGRGSLPRRELGRGSGGNLRERSPSLWAVDHRQADPWRIRMPSPRDSRRASPRPNTMTSADGVEVFAHVRRVRWKVESGVELMEPNGARWLELAGKRGLVWSMVGR